MKKIKNLDYYLSLDYDVKVVRVEDDGDFLYKAYASELDSSAFYGVGATKAEAINSFEEVRRNLFEHFFERGIPTPEPQREEQDLPSGRFLLRTTSDVHARLTELARSKNQSLNAFVNDILVRYVTADMLYDAFQRGVEAVVRKEWTRSKEVGTEGFIEVNYAQDAQAA